MRTRRALVRWFSDWRNGATLVASVAVAVLVYTVIDGSMARRDAVDTRNRSAAAATRRIDRLNDRISELSNKAEYTGVLLGQALAQITALQEQVRQLGGRPVVVRQAQSTTSTTQRPATTTTTTTVPRSTTTTTEPCIIMASGRCVKVRNTA